MRKEPTREDLIKARERALNNACRQRARVNKGYHVRVRPEFWEQVASEYTQQIQDIVMGEKFIPQKHKQWMMKLPTSIVIEGAMLKNEIRIDGKILRPERSLSVHNHSKEFNWGYGGSGPAQFALALLLKYVDKDVAQKYYHLLKFEWVAGLPRTDFRKNVNLRQIMIDIIKNK